MEQSDFPTKISVPFASGAESSYIRTVPTTTTDANAASFTLGFPPNTFISTTAGGQPPDGRDVNGILNAATSLLQAYSAGSVPTFDATFASSVGGYPTGAVVSSAQAGYLWLSTADSNTTTPGSTGSKWVLVLTGTTIGTYTSGRWLNTIVFTSSGTYIPSASAKWVRVRVLGAGGAGAGGGGIDTGSVVACSGGAAGSYAEAMFLVSVVGGSVAITIGSGGIAGEASGASGGTTSFGSYVSAPGGQGGLNTRGSASAPVVFAPQGPPGGAASASGSAVYSVRQAGQPGPCGMVFSGTCVSGQGAPSQFGGGGPNTSLGAGNPAAGYGAGGSGASIAPGSTGYSGGNGGSGLIVIEEISG